MNDGYKIFRKEAELIQNVYPGLKLSLDNLIYGAPIILGKIELLTEYGSYIDSYQLKIVAVPEYPTKFPLVYELDGRIPKNVDWHVYPNDGHFCICSQPEEILACKKGLNLHSFIEDYIKPYLFSQKFREDKGYFLRERSHGKEGVIQFFMEVFESRDLMKIVHGLSFIKYRKEPNRVDVCFCGSGKKYRKCHKDTYRKLSLFSDIELDYFIELFLNWHKNLKGI